MKSVRILTITLLMLVAATVSVQAQERAFAKATIPFDFTVQNVNLPAGTYVISNLAPYRMIKIQNTQQPGTAMVPVVPTEGIVLAESSKLLFDPVGDHYFLTQVTERDSAIRRDVQKGSLEIELARNHKPATQETILAGNVSGK